MSLEKIFPVYTRVAEKPYTILKAIDPAVFDYPFFNEGVHQMNRFAKDKTIYGLENLPMAEDAELLKLQGFIFHTSHCGSTLLSRMLGSFREVRVVSETEAINGLLLSFALYNLPEKEVLLHLKQIIDAYRQPLKDEKFLIFKLSSWNVFFIHLFQQLYPVVPWLYLDRKTEEVVNSLLVNGGGFAEWWDHPADVLRRYFLGEDFTCNDKESYLRQMVEGHRYFAQANKNEPSRFLNYPEFMNEFESVILPHFNLQFPAAEVQQALQMKDYESKQFEKTLYKMPFKK